MKRNNAEIRLEKIDIQIGMKYLNSPRTKMFEDLLFCFNYIRNCQNDQKQIELCVKQRDEIFEHYEAKLKQLPEQEKGNLASIPKSNLNAFVEIAELRSQVEDLKTALETIASYQGEDIGAIKNIAKFHLATVDKNNGTEIEVG